MKIKELYDAAVANKCEDYEVRLQYQDDGGCYSGNTGMNDFEINDEYEEVVLY